MQQLVDTTVCVILHVSLKTDCKFNLIIYSLLGIFQNIFSKTIIVYDIHQPMTRSQSVVTIYHRLNGQMAASNGWEMFL